MGKQLVMNHVLQYASGQLEPEQIGKLIRTMPFANAGGAADAGLFVQAKKGPVLLNYGLEECRFTKPVYPGMTIGVRATVKEKVDQEKKDDIAKGIVKFLVDVYDETGETVAIATILTMIKKKNQD